MAVATEMAATPPLLKSCFTFRKTGIDSKIHYSNFKLRYLAAPIRTSSSTTVPADSKRSKTGVLRNQNVDGDFSSITHASILMSVAGWLRRSDGKSAVFKQPRCDEHRTKALQGVYHCGYHSEKSYRAASYFITRPKGDILIDSPRYTKILSAIIKKMGGASFMFLTHRDDVADHEKGQRSWVVRGFFILKR